ERETRRTELLTMQDEINRLKFDFEQDLRAKERVIEPVLEKIMNIVADVAERDGYDVVLRGEVVIYGRDSANLTDTVIKELDAREAEILPLFTVTPEPTPGVRNQD